MSAGLLPLLPTGLAAWAAPRAVEKAGAGPTLTPRVSRTSFFGADGPSTEVWGYDGVPGPVLRARQGERLRVPVVNGLPEPTTVHWHGLRVDNAMDGVAWLTQPPIAPGETFTYELALKDAGTFWYHPHANSAEQVGRGLYGALIVEEIPSPWTGIWSGFWMTGVCRKTDRWRPSVVSMTRPMGVVSGTCPRSTANWATWCR
jgi:FtsP/CotA-like multicopper oxidase with cupredoxin domain